MTIRDPYGFIYITTNMLNGKQYVGKKVFDIKGGWRSYLGSGKVLKQAIQKYGRKNFKKRIIHICYSEDELANAEKSIISLLDAKNNEDYYNIAEGGEGYNFFGKIEQRAKCSHPVYCITTGIAYMNANVASKRTGEQAKMVIQSCRNYHNKTHETNTDMQWCYLEDMYRAFSIRSNVSAKPVVDLNTWKIYASRGNAEKAMNIRIHRRNVVSPDEYRKIKNRSKRRLFMHLTDFLSIYEHTNISNVDSLF